MGIFDTNPFKQIESGIKKLHEISPARIGYNLYKGATADIDPATGQPFPTSDWDKIVAEFDKPYETTSEDILSQIRGFKPKPVDTGEIRGLLGIDKPIEGVRPETKELMDISRGTIEEREQEALADIEASSLYSGQRGSQEIAALAKRQRGATAEIREMEARLGGADIAQQRIEKMANTRQFTQLLAQIGMREQEMDYNKMGLITEVMMGERSQEFQTRLAKAGFRQDQIISMMNYQQQQDFMKLQADIAERQGKMDLLTSITSLGGQIAIAGIGS